MWPSTLTSLTSDKAAMTRSKNVGRSMREKQVLSWSAVSPARSTLLGTHQGVHRLVGGLAVLQAVVLNNWKHVSTDTNGRLTTYS